ncbi:MAG TPA: hypothetical protein VFQ77_18435, partial [Pseudonocardiaceae bacterium]|nr:hypothetical protein [Pseudonocardiaceae bacterium]
MWPRSTSRAVMGVAAQGSASSAAYRPGWFCSGGEHELRAPVVQVLGVAALGVQGICGDHRVGQVDPGGGEGVQQRGEHGDLVGLRADLDLAEHQGVLVRR